MTEFRKDFRLLEPGAYVGGKPQYSHVEKCPKCGKTALRQPKRYNRGFFWTNFAHTMLISTNAKHEAEVEYPMFCTIQSKS